MCAQLESINENLSARKELWKYYDELLSKMEKDGPFKLLRPPTDSEHNAHMMALQFSNSQKADDARLHLTQNGVQAVIHYVPLHSSPVGGKLGYSEGDLPVTTQAAACLIRLPLHLSMEKSDIDYVVKILQEYVYDAD